MFERYTDKSRRVIFFARYEASQLGSPYIETEHVLLGILREDKALTNRILRSHASVESIRKQIEARTVVREKSSTSVDLPISDECKRVLARGAEEAERLGNKHVGTAHLLLGLLCEEGSFASAILKERGVTETSVREELTRAAEEPARSSASQTSLLTEFTQDLTQAAIDGQLEVVVGREPELNAVIEILCSRDKKNPVIVGDRGVGKAAIVERLAQRIADGEVPASLAGKRILTVDLQLLSGTMIGRQRFDELSIAVKVLVDSGQVILFLDGVRPGLPSAASAITHALISGRAQCIAAGSSGEFGEAMQAGSWMQNCFRAVHVRPLDEEGTLAVLRARKARYESFHGVNYADDALAYVMESSASYLPESALPGKALELIDAAGARVKLRQAAPPAEIVDVLKRLKFIAQKTENSIANDEFEKARFYSDEERKERENLLGLREKYHLDDAATSVVNRQDIEEVIARWAAYPFCS